MTMTAAGIQVLGRASSGCASRPCVSGRESYHVPAMGVEGVQVEAPHKKLQNAAHHRLALLSNYLDDSGEREVPSLF